MKHIQFNTIQCMIVVKAITLFILSIICAFLSVDSNGQVDAPAYMTAATVLLVISFALAALMVPAISGALSNRNNRS